MKRSDFAPDPPSPQTILVRGLLLLFCLLLLGWFYHQHFKRDWQQERSGLYVRVHGTLRLETNLVPNPLSNNAPVARFEKVVRRCHGTGIDRTPVNNRYEWWEWNTLSGQPVHYPCPKQEARPEQAYEFMHLFVDSPVRRAMQK